MKKIVLLSLSIFGFSGLFKIFSIVPFNRMAADDYSSAVMARLGLWGSIVATYKTSMGRFTAVIIETPFVSILADDGKVMMYSIITFSILFVSFSLLIKRAFSLKINNICLYIISSVLVACLYQLTPNKSESWYWLTGSVVYLWPIILSLNAFSYLFEKQIKKVAFILPIVLTFFSVSANEAFGFITIASLTAAFILLRKDKSKRNLVLSMLTASLISFLIMYLAPGNDVRKSSYGSFPMSLPGSVFYSISEGPKLYLSIITNNIYFLFPLIALLSSVFIFLKPKKTKEKVDLDEILFKSFIIIVFGLVLSAVYMLPSFVGLGRVQPDRSALSLAFIVVSQVLFISYFLARVISIKVYTSSYSYKIIIFFSALLLLYSATVFTNTFPQDVYIAKTYSEEFDAMISKLKDVSQSDNPEVETEVSLPEAGLIAKLLDPPGKYSYKNLSLSQYYKVGKVITKEYEYQY
jgi:hypothetical protein